MKRIGSPWKGEHDHLERHDHWKNAQIVHYLTYRTADSCNVPCCHRSTYENEYGWNYGDKEAELYDGEWKRVEKESTITEATLKAKDRNKLEDSEFGLPELRKYPLNDREHVLAAIRFFNRCPYGYEEELAKRIKRKMKEFKISSSIVGNKNNLNRYL